MQSTWPCSSTCLALVKGCSPTQTLPSLPFSDWAPGGWELCLLLLLYLPLKDSYPQGCQIECLTEGKVGWYRSKKLVKREKKNSAVWKESFIVQKVLQRDCISCLQPEVLEKLLTGNRPFPMAEYNFVCCYTSHSWGISLLFFLDHLPWVGKMQNELAQRAEVGGYDLY